MIIFTVLFVHFFGQMINKTSKKHTCGSCCMEKPHKYWSQLFMGGDTAGIPYAKKACGVVWEI